MWEPDYFQIEDILHYYQPSSGIRKKPWEVMKSEYVSTVCTGEVIWVMVLNHRQIIPFSPHHRNVRSSEKHTAIVGWRPFNDNTFRPIQTPMSAGCDDVTDTARRDCDYFLIHLGLRRVSAAPSSASWFLCRAGCRPSWQENNHTIKRRLAGRQLMPVWKSTMKLNIKNQRIDRKGYTIRGNSFSLQRGF